jgi:glyoxylase-like metal-dependent hydrolase (beta-lactamase superfamily II)
LSLFGGKDRIDLYYFGPGHTNGDAFIVFPAVRAMHSGDIFSGKRTPLIDSRNGGSAVSLPDSLAKAEAGIKDVDTIIPGHNPLLKWSDLHEYIQFNRDFLAAVDALHKAGKTAKEAAAALKMPEKYSRYDQLARANANVAGVYAELKYEQ